MFDKLFSILQNRGYPMGGFKCQPEPPTNPQTGGVLQKPNVLLRTTLKDKPEGSNCQPSIATNRHRLPPPTTVVSHYIVLCLAHVLTMKQCASL